VSALHANNQFEIPHRYTMRLICLIITPLLLAIVISCERQEDNSHFSNTNRVGIEVDVNWTVLTDRKLLFKSDADGDFDLYIADGYKRQIYRVTDDRHHNRYADPSPDGKTIVFAGNGDGGDFDLYIVNIDGNELRQITNNDFEDYSPSWSPDGEHIAYENDDNFGAFFRILVLDVNSGINKIVNPQDNFYSYGPEWSNDGTELAVFNNSDGDFDIYSLNIVEGTTRQLTNDGTSTQFPDYAPGGDSIVYESFTAKDGWQLWTSRLNQPALPTRITYLNGEARNPDWSPDGSQIAFEFVGPYSSDIWIIENDGSNPIPLLSTPGRDGQPVFFKQ